MTIDPYYIQNAGFVTATKAKNFMKCPACFKAIEDGYIPPSTAAMEFGTLMHEIMEKGVEHFTKHYEILEPRKKTTTYEGFKHPITNSEGQKIMNILDEMSRHPIFDIGGEYLKEEALTGKFRDKLPLRSKLDRISVEKGLIRDWKFTADPEKFKYAILDFNYLFSMAFYWILAKQKYDKEFRLILDVVGTNKLSCRSIEIPHEMIAPQIPIVRSTLDSIIECKENDSFLEKARSWGRCTGNNPAYLVCPNAVINDFETYS